MRHDGSSDDEKTAKKRRPRRPVASAVRGTKKAGAERLLSGEC